MMMAQVLVNVKADNLDRFLTYRVPDSLSSFIKPGVMVSIPLGRKAVDGWIWDVFHDEDKITVPAGVKIKDILGMVEQAPVLSREALSLAAWIADRYYCRLLDALSPFLPPAWGRIKGKKICRLYPAVDLHQLQEITQELKKKAPRQADILKIFLAEGSYGIELSRMVKEKGCSRQAINTLQKKGLLAKDERRSFRNPITGQKLEEYVNFQLSSEQKEALDVIYQKLEQETSNDLLLYGVTGSGKTEVYLRAVERVLQQKKGAIILVPEITLTPQMIQIFAGYFGSQLAILHSRLSTGERYDEWWRVYKGKAKVVLGARSAIFAPLPSLGLIVIDEEHEISYKQEENPRYHVRDVALWRCRYHKALALLGSATPSLETYYRASANQTSLLLRKRIGDKPLPHVTVVDMRRELKEGHKSMFSRELICSMETAFHQEEQVVLFLNRRGYASFVLCRNCGYVEKCPHCEVSLTYHDYLKKLTCHYCSYTSFVPIRCSTCSSPYIKLFGVGTQRLEQEMRRHFPGVGVIRVDSDTTTKKGSHKNLLDAFAKKEASVLIGTQMIAKGLNFPEVTLVGIVAADTALNFPDFRAGERTFQLLTQVAGRAGRGQKKGRVLIQTYAPQHESIVNAARHDYKSFYEKEIENRKLLQYPPFQQLLLFLFRSLDELDAEKASRFLEEKLQRLKHEHNLVFEIMGPVPSPLKKIKNYFRWQLLLKGTNLESCSPLMKELVYECRREYGTKVLLTVDFDPYMML